MDLKLVALCSGYGPNTNDVYKGIKSLGRHFTGGHTDIGNKQPRAPEMSVVLGMFDITGPLSLYDAVYARHTHLLDTQDTLPVDGLLDFN